MSTTKIEFAVQMTCDACVNTIRQSLENEPGIKNIDINLETGSVVVDTNLPSFEVLKKIQSVGKKAVIKGAAGSSAAVAVIENTEPVGDKTQGVVRFMQVDDNTCVIDGTIDKLQPGEYQLEIHECGDISKGCRSTGDIYNPSSYIRRGSRPYGDLGSVSAENNGRAAFRLENHVINLSDIIGRSLVITSKEYSDPTRLKQACGIIARSSGLFQNPKTICACDGVSLWDEQNDPKGKL